MAIPTSKLWFIGVAAAALAAAALAPFEPLYDPWAWLVWGKEAAALDLNTEAGPSWKPLPVIVAIPLSLLGDAAPDAWLLIAQAGWLAAVGLAALLASRLAIPAGAWGTVASLVATARVRRARVTAAIVAGAGVALLADPFTAWSRQFAGGLSEPLLVALVLGAAERELSHRPGQALALGFAAALLRPEGWPALAFYTLYLWRHEIRLRPAILAGAVALPVLWLGPDLLGSGDPLTGADRAREGSGSAVPELLEALGRALELPLAALWPAAAWAVYRARHDGEREILALAAVAASWVLAVAVLAAVGYAGLPRFAAPGGALVCVLGATGLVRLLVLADRRAGRRSLAALAAALVIGGGLAAQGAWRAAQVPGELEAAADYGRGVEELRSLSDEVAAAAGCESVTTADFYTHTALAWSLGRPLDGVAIRIRTAPEEGLMFVDSDADAALAAALRQAASLRGRVGRWAAYAVSCAARGSSASGRAIAGVTGAER